MRKANKFGRFGVDLVPFLQSRGSERMKTFYPTVKFHRVNPDAPIPRYAKAGDAGMDLCSMQDVTLAPGETRTVGTGISVAIPEGYVGLVFPRSGLGSRGLTLSNCVGVIDSGYRGEIKAPLHNNNPTMKLFDFGDGITDVPNHHIMHVSKGERVCQLVIMPYCIVNMKEVEELDASERGTSGFGSSGTGRL